MVHLGRPEAPRKAAGQMDLLTVPSRDGAGMRSRQDVTGRAGLIYQPPLATAKPKGPNDTVPHEVERRLCSLG